MIKLFFDIETIPSSEEQKAVHLEILRNKNGNSERSEKELHESTSFEGTFGRLCCIGIIKEDSGGIIQKDVFSGEEHEILTKFWQAAQGVHRFVGHNIWAFDLPFVYKRSIINGIKPRELNFARYRNVPIYDTMLEWELWNIDRSRMQKLDTLAKVLGLPSSKDAMDGSLVWPYYQEGRLEEICTYCMKDVELTRQVYYKMVFEEMPKEQTVPVLEKDFS